MFQMLDADGVPVQWKITNFGGMMQWVMVWLLRQLPEEEYPGHAAFDKAHPELVQLRKKIESAYGMQLNKKLKSGRIVEPGAIALAVLERLDGGQTVEAILAEKLTALLSDGKRVQKEFKL